MDIDYVRLYIRDNKEQIREWRIGVENSVIVIEYGVLNGAMITQREEVKHGKAARTRNEQIMSRMASRIHKRRDMGYSPNIEDAMKHPVNSLGFKKPMLAQPLKNVKNIDFSNAYVQSKFDGNRMLIANIGGQKIAYSRNGKLVETVDHILDEIEMPEGTILDGEIYCHGESLQTIVSWVKRKQENSFRLKYHTYDIIDDAPFYERFAMLKDVSYGSNAILVPTTKINRIEEVMEYFRISRKGGYEGEILRWGDSGYEDGKRSKSLVKIKEWMDDEFVVVDITPSADGWAVLTCMTNDNEDSFRVSAPGDMYEKQMPIDDPLYYLGRTVRVEYSQVTKDGIPFHPIATEWRDKAGE